MGKARHFAHTLPDRGVEEWQPLLDHLDGVAARALSFCESFSASEWGWLAGLWHDLGKYSVAFQEYLSTASSPDSHIADRAVRTDHSTAGAQHAVRTAGILGHLLAYVISGHHSGLLDGRGDCGSACLEARLKKNIEHWDAAPAEVVGASVPEPPEFLGLALASRDGFSAAFFTRMLYSSLVDADYLDTEKFMDPTRAYSRPDWPADVLERMASALTAHLDTFAPAKTSVNRRRAEVREACLAAAACAPGLFSLTVPTGGGKTLSSLAFALEHARRYGHKRVIYVIPFTSIIEQNAQAFRDVFTGLAAELGSDPVLEHHSNLDLGSETVTSRLSAENWDAPLVVTTSVQFYESLFAARSSRCRKLHHLAEAVIILDEAQTLPVESLSPCLRALRELSANYRSTIVLCTATQPAVHHREAFPIGLSGVREIIPDAEALYRNLKRVSVGDLGPKLDSELVEMLRGDWQSLCIVNTRSHARRLFEVLGEDEGHFHLSALMCPVHRSERLAEIRRRLDDQQVCRVVSTQLVEAGVDIDFPRVYRALAGLDSIVQAAGRCNRHGRLDGNGETLIFRTEHTRSERFFAETSNCAAQVLDLHDDPLSLAAIEHYFRLYYWDQAARWDSRSILEKFNLLQEREFPFSFAFAEVEESFRLIDDSGSPVIVPWGAEGERLCEELRRFRESPGRERLRALQRYTVQIPRRIWDQQVGRTIDLVGDRYPVLINPQSHYSESVGLSLDADCDTPMVV
jgi:CRISPR-associated endonuclease/helicase Cas3